MNKLKSVAGLIALGLALTTACTNKQQAPETSNAAEAKTEVKAEAKKSEATASTSETPKAYAVMNFEEETYDFGEINEGDIVEHTFSFKNNGEVPLTISDIKTSCGCTTPHYTKTPVKPGEEGVIDIKFNSKGKKGIQNKRITIHTNVEGGKKVVSIKGKVNASDLEGPYKKDS